MATVSDLVATLAEETGWPIADIRHRARRLREEGLLPQKGRGLGAAHVNASQCAALLIAILANDAAKDAPQHVRIFSKLLSYPGNPKINFKPKPAAVAILKTYSPTSKYENARFGRVFGDVINRYSVEGDELPTINDVKLITSTDGQHDAFIFVTPSGEDLDHLWFTDMDAPKRPISPIFERWAGKYSVHSAREPDELRHIPHAPSISRELTIGGEIIILLADLVRDTAQEEEKARRRAARAQRPAPTRKPSKEP